MSTNGGILARLLFAEGLHLVCAQSVTSSPSQSKEGSHPDTTKAMLIFIGTIGGFLFLLWMCHCAAGGSVKRPVIPTPKEYLVADALFKEIDTDLNGTIDPDELLAYLLKKGELPSRVHVLLMNLDTNKDGHIDLEEWRRGWLNGMIGPDGAGPAAPAAPAEGVADEEAPAVPEVNAPEWSADTAPAPNGPEVAAEANGEAAAAPADPAPQEDGGGVHARVEDGTA